MLMVVFGAGASYDSISVLPAGQTKKLEDRPPLANELFEAREDFLNMLQDFPECQPIIARLRHFQDGSSVEQAMRELQTEAETYPAGHAQLAAVRFYLQRMLGRVGDAWWARSKGNTNYLTLLGEIDRLRKPAEPVILVTFNYDTLLDRSLTEFSVPISGIDAYIAHKNYKLIKLHGSADWGRIIVGTVPGNIFDLSQRRLTRELIARFAELHISRKFVKVDGTSTGPKFKGDLLFPAIALPVEVKSEFVCPDEHLAALKQHLPQISKLIVIGWRGREDLLLKLLDERVPKSAACLVVAKDVHEANDTINSMVTHGIKLQFRTAEGGFTDFVRKRSIVSFLKS